MVAVAPKRAKSETELSDADPYSTVVNVARRRAERKKTKVIESAHGTHVSPCQPMSAHVSPRPFPSQPKSAQRFVTIY
jgi:hypothetical protein